MEMLTLLSSSGFMVVGSGSGHWTPFSLLEMFPCCCEEWFVTPVCRTVCCMEGYGLSGLVLHWADVRMIGWMCGVELRDRLYSIV